MASIKHFLDDRRGGVVERVGLIVGCLSLTAVGLSSVLDRALREGSMPQIALLRPDGSQTIIIGDQKPAQRQTVARAGGNPGIDYSTVGSIDKIKIDPCTGERKK